MFSENRTVCDYPTTSTWRAVQRQCFDRVRASPRIRFAAVLCGRASSLIATASFRPDTKYKISSSQGSRATERTKKDMIVKMEPDEFYTFRVQYLADMDPFNCLTMFPLPTRAPTFAFASSTPLATQLGAIVRLLNAPQRVQRNL